MMTDDEKAAVLALAVAWNKMIACDAANSETIVHLHALQHAVMAKATRRLHPDIFS